MRAQKITPKPTTTPQAMTAPTKPVIVTPMPSAPRPDRIMRRAEVQQRVGVRGKSTIYRWVKNNEFPAPLALGGGAVGWRESDIDAWIASRQPVILPSDAQ